MLLLELSCERKYNTGAFVWDIFVREGAVTLMRTSGTFGGATYTSSMDKGFPASHATAALHLITWKIEIRNVSTVHFIHRKYDFEDWLWCLSVVSAVGEESASQLEGIWSVVSLL